MSKPSIIASVPVNLPDGRRVRVIAYDTQDIRVRVTDPKPRPYSITEAFLTGTEGQHTIIKLTPMDRKNAVDRTAVYLARTVSTWPAARTPESVELQVQNLGADPAIDCVYVYGDGIGWRISPAFHCAPGSKQPVIAPVWNHKWPPKDVVGDPDNGRGEALICTDPYGRIHRFLPGRSARAERSWGEDEAVPDWVTWYRSVGRNPDPQAR